MLVEFKIINDPLRPSICTNLCSVCYRNHKYESKNIGCCSYEPEFCLFDLVFLYLHYPDIYELILKKGQIIKGYNGIMLEMKSGLNHCPFASDNGCVLPKDALTPLCRLFICREAAIFGPAIIEEKFDEYFLSKEYCLNNFLNSKLTLIYDKGFTRSRLHHFITEFSQTINTMITGINRTNPRIETFNREINLKDFGILV
ncbi:MAG: hypothetical protein P4L69_09285 [Desulfosporosinus sp.]|nr:hypothetical protein [Desulfosporosinus sp.]